MGSLGTPFAAASEVEVVLSNWVLYLWGLHKFWVVTNWIELLDLQLLLEKTWSDPVLSGSSLNAKYVPQETAAA